MAASSHRRLRGRDPELSLCWSGASQDLAVTPSTLEVYGITAVMVQTPELISTGRFVPGS
jgi:hypothetical protein